MSGGPQFLAVTPDNTRVYATLGFVQGIAVIDAETLQQVKVGTSGVITLPGAANPYQIAIDPRGRYAAVSDFVAGIVYVIDIDPNSDTYNQCVRTIPVPTYQSSTGFSGGLRGLAFSSTAPGSPWPRPATRNTWTAATSRATSM